MLKMKYKDLTAFPFQMVMQKLGGAATDGKTAYRINLMSKALRALRDQVSKEFKAELLEVFVQRDAEGKYDEKEWKVAEGKQAEYEAAEEAFGNREVSIDRPRFTTHDIRDIKLTADELGALEPILDAAGFDAPEVPATAAPLMGKGKMRQA